LAEGASKYLTVTEEGAGDRVEGREKVALKFEAPLGSVT
jgi:hypothetical protein